MEEVEKLEEQKRKTVKGKSRKSIATVDGSKISTNPGQINEDGKQACCVVF